MAWKTRRKMFYLTSATRTVGSELRDQGCRIRDGDWDCVKSCEGLSCEDLRCRIMAVGIKLQSMSRIRVVGSVVKD